MRCKTLISSGAACLALAAAAPAAADDFQGTALYPETVPGAGLTGVAGQQATIRRVLRGTGSTATAVFTIGTKKLVFADLTRSLRFQSLKVATVRFGTNDARLKGVGLLNGRRVGFSAVAVHNASPGVDTIRISLGKGASLGGRVLKGSVFIR
jgi:ABC-type amino acid transport substrate-binding protein